MLKPESVLTTVIVALVAVVANIEPDFNFMWREQLRPERTEAIDLVERFDGEEFEHVGWPYIYRERITKSERIDALDRLGCCDADAVSHESNRSTFGLDTLALNVLAIVSMGFSVLSVVAYILRRESPLGIAANSLALITVTVCVFLSDFSYDIEWYWHVIRAGLSLGVASVLIGTAIFVTWCLRACVPNAKDVDIAPIARRLLSIGAIGVVFASFPLLWVARNHSAAEEAAIPPIETYGRVEYHRAVLPSVIASRIRRVKSIYLVRSVLREDIYDLSPLSAFTAAEKLYLHYCEAEDYSPISKLRCLTELDLGSSQIDDLTPLRDMPQLQTLDLSYTEVRDIGPLSNATGMMHLDLADTEISEIAALKRLDDLETLRLTGTNVSDLAPLAGTKSLREFRCDNTPISSLASISGNADLRVLYVSDTKVGDLNVVAKLHNLERLSVGGTLVSDLSPLRDCTAIELLMLDKSPVKNIEPLGDLPNLATLNLIETEVDDISALRRCKSLETVFLPKSLEGSEQVTRLKIALPRCDVNFKITFLGIELD